jgi:hypothetical protein
MPLRAALERISFLFRWLENQWSKLKKLELCGKRPIYRGGQISNFRFQISRLDSEFLTAAHPALGFWQGGVLGGCGARVKGGGLGRFQI